MDKKAEKFWEEISQKFEELVAMTNKLSEKNPKYEVVETNWGIEPLHNCSQHCLEPSIQKFPVTIYQNAHNSGKVKDDVKMDLYYAQMREEHTSHFHTYTKDMPKHLVN